MLRALLSRTPISRVRRTNRTRRVGCELLEGRQLLATFMVNNLGDDWVGGTLRVSLAQAAQTPGDHTVVFDPTVFNVPRTITLTRNYPLSLGSALGSINVIGPGSNMLTVQGNNTSTVFGNAIWHQPASLSGMTITGGYSSGYGGGLDASGSGLSLTDVVFQGNSSGRYGGGASIFSTSGTTTLTNVAFIGNSASHEGGGLFIGGNSATLTNVTFTNNTGLNGGGMYTVSGSRTLTNVTFTNNSASGYGGGMSAADGEDSLESVTFNGNTAPMGGGLFTDIGARTLTNVTFSNNMATTSGGGIFLNGGSTALTNVTVSNNTTTGLGGGIYDASISSTYDTVLIHGNFAHRGGGLFASAGTHALANVTIAGNTALAWGGGAWLYDGTNRLTNVTVSANTAPVGGGVYMGADGSNTLKNTIVAGNAGYSDVAYYVSNPHTGSNNLIGGDPKLAPLGDYGGPMLTMLPISGSPAIGGGVYAGLATDQRGFNRFSPVDIGAVQTQVATTLTVSTTGDAGAAAGKYSLRAAVNVANAKSGPTFINFDSSLFGAPQTITLTKGELALTDTATTTISGPGANLLTISGNNASRVFKVNGSAAISGLAVANGQAPGGGTSSGGGIYNSGGASLSLNNVLVSGSHATSGGGIANWGTAALSNVTLGGNSALVGGGMINFGTANLTNATVSGNSASSFGGGLYNYLGSMALNNVTVSGNSAAWGGGVVNYWGNTSLTNTIVAGNGGGDVSGSAVSGTNNLIGGSPLLAPLGYYGGQVPTMALLPGSPAINAGTTYGFPTTDPRGVARGIQSDIGAFESRGFSINAVGGYNQSTRVNTTFAGPLQFQVTSPYGEPVAGGAVWLTAPTSGASASFSSNPATIDGQGYASVAATANGTVGTYQVSASVRSTSTAFAMTNTAGGTSLALSAPAAAHDDALAQLDDSPVRLGKGSGVMTDSLRPSARPETPVNTRLRYASNAALPDATGVRRVRNRFSRAFAKDLARESAIGQLN